MAQTAPTPILMQRGHGRSSLHRDLFARQRTAPAQQMSETDDS
jgi:hypothetical protein